jgi:hypothetical protein
MIIPIITGATGIATKVLKKNFGTFSRVTTKDSCTWNVTHNRKSAVV